MTENLKSLSSEPTLGASSETCIDAPFRIRRATMLDAEDILRLQADSMQLYRMNSCIPEGCLEALEETIDTLCIDIRAERVLVAADADDMPVGAVRILPRISGDFRDAAGTLLLPSLSACQPVAYFSRFAVSTTLHNAGIGGMLYRAAETAAREVGFPWMCLHTATGNQDLVLFYRRRGFELLWEDISRGYPRGLFAKSL